MTQGGASRFSSGESLLLRVARAGSILATLGSGTAALGLGAQRTDQHREPITRWLSTISAVSPFSSGARLAALPSAILGSGMDRFGLSDHQAARPRDMNTPWH